MSCKQWRIQELKIRKGVEKILGKTERSFKLLVASIVIFTGISMGAFHVQANGQAPSYNYSYWGDSISAPDAYKPTTLVNGEDLGIGPFIEPSDIHVTEDQMIYVVDSGNNRVVMLNHRFQLIDTVASFDNNGKKDQLSNPQGIFVTKEKQIFIADTGNNRIVQLDQNYQLVTIIEQPSSDLLKDDFVFQPLRVVVDNAGRVYTMAEGVFDGFMEFNVNGEFNTFIGANRVQVDPIELLWKRLSTQAQRSQMVMFIPTEFTNLDINEEGFIYATNGDNSSDKIKKLNARGTDILRREGYFDPIGDIRYPIDIGPSRLIDIDVSDSEMYSVLDSKRGRIFTYNNDGHLMYVFGGIGNRRGLFHTPVAIERVSEQFLVLDKALGEITVFKATNYGHMINQAVRSYYEGDEESAYHFFKEVIEMNANLEFAYAGIGKALLRQGDYKGAMENFKKSLDQKNYSKAFLLYRKEVLKDYFPTILTTILVAVIGLFVWRFYRKLIKRRKEITIE